MIGPDPRTEVVRHVGDKRQVAALFEERGYLLDPAVRQAQEFGVDQTDPIDMRAVGLTFTLGRWGGVRWSVDAALERFLPSLRESLRRKSSRATY